jgi:nitrogen fixation NifU-like protein
MNPENNLDKSQDEFREILLNHARHPKRMGVLNDAHGIGQCHNPLCGDKVSVSFIAVNGVIQSLKISPSGCSISIASASMMGDMIEGKPLSIVRDLIGSVNDHFSPANFKNPWSSSLAELSPLKRIRENPLKIPCVLISWFALKDALANFEKQALLST